MSLAKILMAAGVGALVFIGGATVEQYYANQISNTPPVYRELAQQVIENLERSSKAKTAHNVAHLGNGFMIAALVVGTAYEHIMVTRRITFNNRGRQYSRYYSPEQS